MMIIAMNNEAKYSKRPWPNGCSLSAGLLAYLNPIKVTIAVKASNKLLKASAIIEMDKAMIPPNNFKEKGWC